MVKTAVDPNLIDRACSGDAAAIEAMLLLYQPMVTRFAHKYCATPEDVEDAVQETLWIAAQKIGSLRVAAAFVSWLFRVVKNQCIRLLEGPSGNVELDNWVRDDRAGLNADVLQEESIEDDVLLHRDVLNALGSLPQAYREILIMRDLQEMSTPEVAAALGLSTETIKSRLHRARNIMRQQLAAWAEQ